MPDDTPKNAPKNAPKDAPKDERVVRLPVTPTIPFPSKTGARAAPTPQDSPGARAGHHPVDAFKRADARVPEPQEDDARGILVAAIVVIAILVVLGGAYWWLRG